VIWKSLTKPISQYEVKAPHMEAAKRLEGKGWKLILGGKIGYVITEGSGKLYERAIPHILVNPGEVDYTYYVDNQIAPATLRVLEIFGLTKEQLMREEPVEAGGAKKAGPSILDFS
jgi:DNA polymerase I/DNA polymerase-2